MVLHDVIFNMIAFVLMKSLIFFKKVYKFHRVGVLIQYFVNKIILAH
jgi:hypothetical protein